jgi:isopenicillin-N N-acyltransferase like protein
MERTSLNKTVEPCFPVVEVSGSAYDMGYQHGRQAADLIRKYLNLIEKLGNVPLSLLCENARAFVPVLDTLSSPFMQEVRGLAVGAGISFEEAVLCQLRTEAAHIQESGCTAFAVTGSATADGHTLAGQNQDLPPEFADVTVLLRVRPDDGRPRALFITFAGQLGYAGMNEHGVGLFNTSLYDYEPFFGVPRQPLKRLLLERSSVGECLSLLAAQRTCSAANLVLCDGADRIADVEMRPEGTAVFDDLHPDRRLHTNHYLTSQFESHETHTVADSRARLNRLRDLVERNWGKITVDTMKSVLADHLGDPAGICRHGAGGWHSIFGVIAEPAQQQLHIRRGHGCTGTWHTYHV